MKYIGIHPQSLYNGKNVDKKFHHSKKVNGKIVNYYEIILIDSFTIKIPKSKSKILEISAWDFQA